MSVSSGLNEEKKKVFLSPGAKQTLHNNEVSPFFLSLPLDVNELEDYLNKMSPLNLSPTKRKKT